MPEKIQRSVSSKQTSSRRRPHGAPSSMSNLMSPPSPASSIEGSERARRTRAPRRSSFSDHVRKSVSTAGVETPLDLVPEDIGAVVSSREGNERARPRLSSSDHVRKSSVSASGVETPLNLVEEDIGAVRRSVSSEQDSLQKARERLHSRTGARTAPSPRPASSRRGVPPGDHSDPLRRSAHVESMNDSETNISETRPASDRSLATGRTSRATGRVRSTREYIDTTEVSIEGSTHRRERGSMRSRGRTSSSATDDNPVDDESTKGGHSERSRSSKRGGSGRNRSRSRSKSAKAKRGGGGRKTQLPQAKETAKEEKAEEKEKSKEPTLGTVMSSSSVKVRRKPASTSSLTGGLSLPARRGSRHGRSVDTDTMFSAPVRSKSSAGGPNSRRVLRSNTTDAAGLGAMQKSLGLGDMQKSLGGLSMLEEMTPRKRETRGTKSVDPEMFSPLKKTKADAAPVRRVMRTKSHATEGISGISSLAMFLNDSDKGEKKSKSSSRSVNSMPTPRNAGADQPGKKPMRRRLKKGSVSKTDDELELQDILRRPPIKRHASYGSGLDFATASSAMETATKGGHHPKKFHSSFGSGLDLHTASDDLDRTSIHVSDLLAGGGSDNEDKKQSSRSRLAKSMSQIPTSKASDLGSILAQQKAQKLLSRSSMSSIDCDEELEDTQEDIFSFYSWSTSRQPRNKIKKERKRLNDSIRHGALLAAYESFVR